MDDREWEAVPYSMIDKVITVYGPDDLVLSVDYDDVNHEEVDKRIPWLLNVLNWAEARRIK